MAKTAAKRAQPRMRGGGRRRSLSDSRQMELFFALPLELTPAPESASAVLPQTAPAGGAGSPPEARPAPPVPRAIEAPPAANNNGNGETEALVAIVDLLLDLWQEATGEDLRPSIFEAQNL